jgi:hypothetical protein
MVAPPGGPYDGVCFFAPAVGGFHSPTIVAHPPGCPVNFAGAAVSSVWDDFTTLCANAGDTLTVKFFGPPGLVGTCTSCATWLDGAVVGDVIVTAGPLDTDEDGCPDAVEPTLTPPTDPNNPWDFYSVPVPALFSAPNPTTTFPDNVASGADAQAVFAYAKKGARTGTTEYEQDLNLNGVKDGIEYDRSVAGPGMSGPPDGVISGQDAQLAFAQAKLGYHC